jgi:hypothetical protein
MKSRPSSRAIGVRVGLAAASLAAVALVSLSDTASSQNVPARLTQAQGIRADVHARAQRLPGVGLRVTAPTTTDAIESFTLLSQDLLERRFVSARNGIWYSICPASAPCVSPAARVARPAAGFLPRRLALELAARTFLATDAQVVAVGLPTPRIVAVVIVRGELAPEADLQALARALGREPTLDSPALRGQVDALTRPRTYVSLGLEPGPSGGPSWTGLPRWPAISW